MATVNTPLNRRSFLKASTLAGGGLLLSFDWLMGSQALAESLNPLPVEAFRLNGFLSIAEDGVVTIMSPNPEIGQNVKTSMPMIVAEELDADWRNVVVEQAPLNTDIYTRQLAGGSQSIGQGWQSLRMAGATARRMLLEAASQRLDVPVDELTTDNGVVTHASGNRSVGYGEVASLAATLPVPADVLLKDPSTFKIIGTSRANVDGPKIVKGEPLFGLDTSRDGMLIAMIKHAPAFGMTLKSFDATEALAMPGIRDVFAINASPPGLEGIRFDVNAFPELVAIVGDSTWQVMKAKAAVSVEWETVSPAESSTDHAAGLGEMTSSTSSTPARGDGDPEGAFANAARVIERTYTAPFLAHNTMEPMNFFADVRDDRAELVGPVQTPEYLQDMAAKVLGMPEDRVSVDMTRMGGGFGRRLYHHFGIEAALISRQVNAPVKLVYSREDDMSQGTYRPAYHVTYRAALDEANELIGFHVRGSGVHGSPVFADRFPAGAVENYLAENFDLDSNVSTGAWRAPRSNFMAVAEQSFLDEVAEAAGKDPIDFRLALFDRAINNPVGTDNDYDAERYAGVLRLVRETSGWDTSMNGVHRGVSAYFCHNSYVAEVVDLVIEDERPRIEKVWGAVDCGIVVNPGAAKNLIEGGIVDGIGHASYSAMTFTDGRPDQTNFDGYRLIRMSESPRAIEVHFVENGIDPTGLGEPGLPPAGAALANAFARATGQRLYEQPFAPHMEQLVRESTG